ncbi:MAG: hypothetical protein AB8H79_10300 [Myxococcota bacterium]
MTEVQTGPTETATTARTWAKRFFVAGNVLLVLGGVGHTFVHVIDMMGADLEAVLRTAGTVDVGGTPLEIWDVFQGQSLIYGAVFIALGVSNVFALRGRSLPSLGSAAAGIALFGVMTAIGFLYLGPLQTVGGPLGILLFGATVAVRAWERVAGASG